MAFTPQEKALDKARELFGRSAFTEDYGTYRRVGYLRGADIFSATGQTWDEAIANLQKKGKP